MLTPFTERSIDKSCRAPNESEYFSAIILVSICERTEYGTMAVLIYMDETNLCSNRSFKMTSR